MIHTKARFAYAICAALMAPAVVTPAYAQNITVEELDPLGDGQDDGPRLTTLQPAQTVEQGRADSGALGELRALDKVNGHTQTSELPVGGTAQMFGVLVTLHECRFPADNPTGDAYGFCDNSQPPVWGGEVSRLDGGVEPGAQCAGRSPLRRLAAALQKRLRRRDFWG